MPDSHNLKNLENQFHLDMENIYRTALVRCKYNATRFLQMINEHAGLETASILLHTPSFQYGFTALWECGCLNITMENLVLQPQYDALFTEEEKNIARTRLQECGFDVK